MIARTISQLPEISMSEFDDDCLFETSKPITVDSEKYTSKKLPYSILNSKIQQDSKSFLSSTYGLTDETDVKTIQISVENLYCCDVSLSGNVNFMSNPTVGESKKPLATQEYVQNNVKENTSTAITPTSTKLDEITDDSLIFQEYTRSKIVRLKPNVTGNLILYGWMADNGTDMHPSKAWVALKRVSSLTDTSEGLILQVKPWIFGTFRNQLQYVSFNIPVSTGENGMFIRIDSGFEVNEENSGSQTSSNSLADSVPNKFVGYILGKES